MHPRTVGTALITKAGEKLSWKSEILGFRLVFLSGCRRRSDRAGLVGARVAQGPYDVDRRARHARHLAGRAQTLQDARKPMHTTDPSTI
jgi:hypothetical protein